jgi:sugar phosphate isomerase/epimerase
MTGMRISRRVFLGGAAASAAFPAAAPAGLELGVMDGVLRQSGKPEALALAKSFGVRGLQVTLGRPGADGRLPLENPELQARYVAESRRQEMPIDATYLDVLHANCLKDDALARQWVVRGIQITRALGAPILMTVFFGKCALANREEMDAVARAFADLAPEAEKAGVILGFENLLKAEDNMRLMDRVNSSAFRIYYDVGNATNMVGVDAAREIRTLGRGRICQFHFKDKGFLGEGQVNFRAVLDAIGEIGFRGYANLETSAPSGVMESDLRRNLEYLRKMM